MRDDLFIGVDGGGTGCRVAIGTHDRVLGEGRGGPANVSSDPDLAIRNILDATMLAIADSGVREVASARAHLGLAGVLTSEQAKRVADAMPFKVAVVTDDRPTTLAGALGDGNGCVAAIGTGSFIGIKRGVDFQYVGGWGLPLGDDASGAWLGRTAFAETLKAHDGLGDRTKLTQAIVTHFDGDPYGLVTFAKNASPAQYAEFAPMVLGAADEWDFMAITLMQSGAQYIETALRTLGLKDGETLCLTGGIGPAYAPFLADEFKGQLGAPLGSALDGALALARAMT